MAVELSLGWNEVYEAWRSYYYLKNDESVKAAFNVFFDRKHFFAPDSKTTNIPLSLGVSPLLGRYEVVMATHICEQLYEHLVNSIPQVEPPSLSDLTPEPYEIIETVEVKDDKVLTKYLKTAKKKNKQVERLNDAKREANLAKRLLDEKKYVFISIDIEAYERDQSILTEIGWSMYDSRTNKYLDQHYINEAYMHLRNGQFVDDERDHFIFGTSVCCSLKQAFQELKNDLLWAKERDGGFVLVGHGLEHDLKFLQQQKFKWPSMYGMDDTLDFENSAKVAMFNTDTIYGATINDLHNPPSLGRTLSLLDIETWHLHNAGNDAHYTLVLLLQLAGIHNFTK